MSVEQIQEAVIKGRAPEVVSLVAAALEQGVAASDLLNEGLCAGMGIVGERFKKNEVFVPQVLLAARAMKQGTDLLKPHLIAAGVTPFATAVIGTIKGDLHDIGKNLVGMMLEGAGFKVVDAGIGVAPEKFVTPGAGARRKNRRGFGAADDHDGDDARCGGGGARGRTAGQGDHRRGTGDAGVLRRDRGGWLFAGCGLGR